MVEIYWESWLVVYEWKAKEKLGLCIWRVVKRGEKGKDGV